MTQRILFCDGWSFTEAQIGTEYEDIMKNGNFVPVEIPHDYMIYDVRNLYRTGEGWYRRTLVCDDVSGKTILRFEGVYMDSTVFVNGNAAFEWKYGYSTFEADITDFIRPGENTIVVRCVYLDPNTRWYSGAGIYRRVWLIRAGDVRIPSDSIYISPKNDGDVWHVHIKSEFSHPDGTYLRHVITDDEGRIIAECTGDDVMADAVDVRRWDPDDPYMYRVITTLEDDGGIIDRAENMIGFREIKFTPDDGFHINGRKFKLHGVCEHHDLGALGTAVNKNALRRQLEMLMTMGVNSIRTSHNMPATELVELCNELGIVIIDESFDMWEEHKTRHDYATFFDEWYERDVKSWITRDRNNPCVIMWSLGNEIGDTTKERGLEVTKLLQTCVRRYDPDCNAYTTTGSNHMYSEWAQKCGDVIDVVGYNYNEKAYDEHHKIHPGYCIYGSETSSTIQSRGIYHFPHEKCTVSHDDHQCSSIFNCTTSWASPCTEYNITRDRAAEFCAGQFIWTGFDYIGEPTPYDTKNSYFGQIDTAGFPKDSYYAYRAEWTDAEKSPIVHITPSVWDFNEGQIIDVTVHTNAARSELHFNGKLIGGFDHVHTPESLQISEYYKIPFEKGELHAVAYDKNGKIVAEDTVRTCGDPDEIVLEADKNTLLADGRDLVFVSISTKDKNGVFVGNARNRINVIVEGAGRLVGVDNGDSTDYEPYKGDSKRLFSGRLVAIIAASDRCGEISVRISSPGLDEKTITLEALPAEVPDGIEIIDECEKLPRIDEIPLRRIDMKLDGDSFLTKDKPSAVIITKLLPENTTYGEIKWCAYAKGTPTELLRVEECDGGAVVTALADGEYKVRAYSYNGTPYPCVYSEIDFVAEGIAKPMINPYKFMYAAISEDVDNNRLGESENGIRLFRENGSIIYRDVDFGKYGSDVISVKMMRVFTSDMPFAIYDVTGGGRELIAELPFTATELWYTYSTNTYKLPHRLTGIRDIEIVISKPVVFGGVEFESPAFAGIAVASCDNVYGDSYSIDGDSIVGIGNNVTVHFEKLALGDGASELTVEAETKNERDAIRIAVGGEEITAEFGRGDREVTVPVSVKGDASVDLIFLPGCRFDLHSIKFKK